MSIGSMIKRASGHRSVILAIALFAAFLAPPAQAQTAEIFVVDDVLAPGVLNCEQEQAEYVTIQSAVNAAAASGSAGEKIVKVCPGVYREYVVVPAPMTINGAQVGMDARQREVATTPLAEESFLTGPEDPPTNGVPAGFFLTASDITIDGFYMGGFNQTLSSGVSGAAVQTNPSVGQHLIQNNVITGNTFGMNLHGSGGSLITQNHFLENNQPGGLSGTGIYSDQGFLNSTITENSFTRNNSQGIVLLGHSGSVDGITISANEFDDNGRSIVLGRTSRTKVLDNQSVDSVGHGFVLEGGNVGTEIERNLVAGSTSGLVISKNYCCPTSTTPAEAVNSGALIRENSFTNSGQNGIWVQEGGASSTTIRENRIRENTTGIRLVGSSTPSLNPTIVANRISGNGAGLVNGSSTVTVLADNNWWGCNGGPSQPGCDTAAPRVNYTPWIVMILTTSKSALAPQETAVITADLTKNSAGGTVPGTSPLPDDTPILFSTDRGTLSEHVVPLGSDGKAQTVLKHTGGPGGNARVSAILDNEEETVTVTMAGPSPSPSATPTPTRSPTPSPTVSPSPSPSPSASGSPSPSPSVSASPSPSPSASVSSSPSPTPTPEPECDDGVDNDNDGDVDFPEDQGCADVDDDSEDSDVSPEETCQGFEGDDRNQIIGTSGDDTLVGTPGDDVICGFGGNDTIRSGDGYDVVIAGSGNDAVSAGYGNDTVKAGGGNDIVTGSLGSDVVRGGGGRDSIRGGDSEDQIYGGRGPDFLRGGKARDRLDGGSGRDTCNGGRGRNKLRSCEQSRSVRDRRS